MTEIFDDSDDPDDPPYELIRAVVYIDDPSLGEQSPIHTQVAISEDELGLIVDDDEQYMSTTLKMAAREASRLWKELRDDE